MKLNQIDFIYKFTVPISLLDTPVSFSVVFSYRLNSLTEDTVAYSDGLTGLKGGAVANCLGMG